jgi:predicted transcriptional regulator
MRKTNEELDALIAEQEASIPEAAEMVDVQRGHVSKALGQMVKNRREAIGALEGQKEMATVNLKAGI